MNYLINTHPVVPTMRGFHSCCGRRMPLCVCPSLGLCCWPPKVDRVSGLLWQCCCECLSCGRGRELPSLQEKVEWKDEAHFPWAFQTSQVGLLFLVALLFLAFWELFILFYMMTLLIYTPTHSAGELHFLWILTRICFSSFWQQTACLGWDDGIPVWL